ncbi:hypothetical protein [Methylocystis parvus]|uniref:hypothetical protein n=1 Tax=Methylocystis parvus TaxID=134 RepID=UPI003C78BB45
MRFSLALFFRINAPLRGLGKNHSPKSGFTSVEICKKLAMERACANGDVRGELYD